MTDSAEWRTWRLRCGHTAVGRADAVPGVSRLHCPREPVFHDQFVDSAAQTEAGCIGCLDSGYVCEDHPDKPWEGIHGPVDGHARHGGIGMPCPACCSPVSADGTQPVTEAFVPDWIRQAS